MNTSDKQAATTDRPRKEPDDRRRCNLMTCSHPAIQATGTNPRLSPGELI
jgi:hypothetical protein